MTDSQDKKNQPPPATPPPGHHYPFSPATPPEKGPALTPVKLDKPAARKEGAPQPPPRPLPVPLKAPAAAPQPAAPPAVPPPPANRGQAPTPSPDISAPTASPALRVTPAPLGPPLVPRPSSTSVQRFDRQKPAPPPGLPPAPSSDPALAGEAPSREDRVVCSFPGLLKVLIPERSFVPFPIAVRIANLSSGGALVEVHDSVKLDKELTLTNRFFELKVAHPDIPELRGSIAWSDYASRNPRLGLSCFERNPALSQVLLSNESAITWEGPPPLPPPEIDPFPPVSSQLTVLISGSAPEAMEVSVKRDDQKFAAPVIKGRFQVSVDLDPNGENHFTLRTLAGTRKSRAIPIRIAYVKESKRRHFFFDTQLKSGEGSGESIVLEFNGSVRQAERVLYRFSQIMAMSERVTINAELSSASCFDRRLFEALRSEGAVLAADTTRNHMAAKLLDELL